MGGNHDFNIISIVDEADPGFSTIAGEGLDSENL